MRRLKLDHERVYVTDKYITDGKVLVTRTLATTALKNQADLKPYLVPLTGLFQWKQYVSDKMPDVEHVVQSALNVEDTDRLSAETSTLLPLGLNARGGLVARVTHANFPVYFNTDFWPAYEAGAAFAKDARSPIVVKDNDGSLLAIIMPMRMSHKLDEFEFPAPAELGAV